MIKISAELKRKNNSNENTQEPETKSKKQKEESYALSKTIFPSFKEPEQTETVSKIPTKRKYTRSLTPKQNKKQNEASPNSQRRQELIKELTNKNNLMNTPTIGTENPVPQRLVMTNESCLTESTQMNEPQKPGNNSTKNLRQISHTSNEDDAVVIEHELELKYRRKKYSANIYGDGIKYFTINIHERLRELKRCVGIENPLLIQPQFDDQNNQIWLKLEVNNYDDYLKLKSSWPCDSFKTGVKVEILPPPLVINILQVDKNIQIDPSSESLNELKKRYGLFNIERVFIGNEKPTNKLRASVTSIQEYINLIKNGLYMNETSKKHHVSPNIVYAKICGCCGSLQHKEKECNSFKRCLRCGLTSHNSENCISEKPTCVNCGAMHHTNSDFCEKAAEKTFQMNEYTLEILTGERVIPDNRSILRKKSIDNQVNLIHHGRIGPETLSDNLLNNKIEDLVKRVNLVEQTVSNHQIEIDEHDIICLQETWLEDMSKKDNLIYVDNKIIVMNKARRIAKKGRASGGMAFILDKRLKYTSKFYSERIGTLTLGNLTIVNVHLHHYDGSETAKFNFDIQLSQIQEIVEQHRQNKRQVVIVGDMNTDLAKDCYNTTKLKSYVFDNKMLLRDIYDPQLVDFTFKRKNSSLIKSWIDHIICYEKDYETIKSVKILTDIKNQSDHNCISFELSQKLISKESILKKNAVKNVTLNWTNKQIRHIYNNKIQPELEKIEKQLSQLNLTETRNNLKNNITKIINELSSTLINAAQSLKNELNYLREKKQKPIGGLKFKRWWDQNIQDIHNDLIDAYIEYRDSNFDKSKKYIFTEKKRLFRLQKRFNIQLLKNKHLNKINELFKLDKSKFWKRIKQAQQNNIKIDIDLEKIRIHYDELFNKNNAANGDPEGKIKLETFNRSYENHKFSYHLDASSIQDTINSLKNGKSIGIHGVSNEMLKYSVSTRLINIIKTLFENMINHQVMPYLFNLSIIKPLIKDPKKSSDDISNLRPVAVSDSLANLFEAILLKEVSKYHRDHELQFGFKAKSSCAHAIFTLQQTIKNSMYLGKWAYITAIDASKAFDKIDRNILWQKLITAQIHPAIIRSIINYYNESLMMVTNDNEYSVPFKTSIGVRQGGVLSPKLFSIYIEDLIIKVEELKAGIKIGDQTVSIILYADDIVV
ncbi:unnamed protein product, partial [Brachionus calyciflorus]